MGIVNVNNDSFYPSSRVSDKDEFCLKVDNMLEDGADIIDIGACSSRPGSIYDGVEEEWKRLSPVLDIIPNKFQTVKFSIDTFSSEIVRRAFDSIGEFIVNDISAGENDENMLNMVASLKLDYVAMHKRGNSITMDLLSQYDDIVSELIDYFTSFSKKANELGIDNWILDPGFGFAKTKEQSLILLENLEQFKQFNRPILVGISRKRMTDNSLEKTLELQRVAISKGATILRVHDVREAKLLLIWF